MSTILRGVRPAALAAISERERLRAHPHRAQAAVNHVRALSMQQPPARSRAADAAAKTEPAKPAKKGRKK
jgi:hypothetical protein